jgi:hypothetical protein
LRTDIKNACQKFPKRLKSLHTIKNMSEFTAYLAIVGIPAAVGIAFFADAALEYNSRKVTYRNELESPQLSFDFVKPEKPRYRDCFSKAWNDLCIK